MEQRGGGCLEKRKSVPFNFKSSFIAYVHSIETPRHITRIRCSPVQSSASVVVDSMWSGFAG